MRFRLLIILWLLADLCVFLGSFTLAYFLRVGWILSTDFPFDRFMLVVALIAPVWLVILLLTRCFGLTRNQLSPRNMAYVCYACVAATSLFALFYYFAFGAFFSRLLLVYALLFSVLGTCLWHIVFQQILRTLLRRDPPVFPTLIVGVTRESQQLIELLNRKRNPLKPVAILDALGTKEKALDGVPVLGRLNKLEDVLREYRITHLIHCNNMEQGLNLVSLCRQKGIVYLLMPSVLGIMTRNESIEALEGKPMTMVRGRRGPWSWFFS